VPPKVPRSLCKRERVRVRVRLDCMDTVKRVQEQVLPGVA